MHPAQHRALRELYATARQLVRHWSALRARLGPESAAFGCLGEGVEQGRALLQELGKVTPRYGLYGDTAAQGVGVQLATGRNALADRFLERNQALRLAVLDVQHVTTLLDYLAELSAVERTEPVRALCTHHALALRSVERAARRAAVELAEDPDAATAPVDPSALGRAAHGAAFALGTAGEWVDRRLGRRPG